MSLILVQHKLPSKPAEPLPHLVGANGEVGILEGDRHKEEAEPDPFPDSARCGHPVILCVEDLLALHLGRGITALVGSRCRAALPVDLVTFCHNPENPGTLGNQAPCVCACTDPAADWQWRHGRCQLQVKPRVSFGLDGLVSEEV